MDAGLAAVIAGASGAGGAALAAWATGRAMVRQVRAQAESGFDQWLRERRQESYANLLSSCDAVHDELKPLIDSIARSRPIDERMPFYRSVEQALTAAQRAARTAAVVGPPDTARKGLAMYQALHSLVDVWRALPDPPADQRASAHTTANQAWMESGAAYMRLVERAMQTFERP
ncbi:hypothetical protein [Streptomyces phaeochromogenes]|uniref:hypothetical protein n=1 Tax=Streptomyces phaeochromogenes TaxID=1923 RepID=UPI003718B362